MPTHVILVYANQLLRTAIVACLRQEAYKIVSQVDSSDEALQQFEFIRPDLVLLGADLPEAESFVLSRTITRRWPQIFVILFNVNARDLLVQADAAMAGATACLLPQPECRRLLAALTVAMRERPLFTHPLHFAEVQPTPLTPREQSVLDGLAEGMTYAQVGHRLGIRYSTVRTHAQNLIEKLGVHSRNGAIRRARRRGLI